MDWLASFVWPGVATALTLMFTYVVQPWITAKLHERKENVESRKTLMETDGQRITNEGGLWDLYRKVVTRVEELEQRVDDLETWQAEATRYMDHVERAIAVVPPEHRPKITMERPKIIRPGIRRDIHSKKVEG